MHGLPLRLPVSMVMRSLAFMDGDYSETAGPASLGTRPGLEKRRVVSLTLIRKSFSTASERKRGSRDGDKILDPVRAHCNLFPPRMLAMSGAVQTDLCCEASSCKMRMCPRLAEHCLHL
jgi:hypothetical protein